jgi:hypothetical protein
MKGDGKASGLRQEERLRVLKACLRSLRDPGRFSVMAFASERSLMWSSRSLPRSLSLAIIFEAKSYPEQM